MQGMQGRSGACHSVNGTQVKVWKSTVQSPRPDSRRDHRLDCVVTEFVSMIRPEALGYCYEFARRVLFAGQSTTGDFQVSKLQRLVVLQGQGVSRSVMLGAAFNASRLVRRNSSGSDRAVLTTESEPPRCMWETFRFDRINIKL